MRIFCGPQLFQGDLADIGLSRCRDPEKQNGFFEDMRAAARTFGFFHLSNQGVSSALQEKIVAIARRFFALPEKDTRRCVADRPRHLEAKLVYAFMLAG